MRFFLGDDIPVYSHIQRLLDRQWIHVWRQSTWLWFFTHFYENENSDCGFSGRSFRKCSRILHSLVRQWIHGLSVFEVAALRQMPGLDVQKAVQLPQLQYVDMWWLPCPLLCTTGAFGSRKFKRSGDSAGAVLAVMYEVADTQRQVGPSRVQWKCLRFSSSRRCVDIPVSQQRQVRTVQPVQGCAWFGWRGWRR